MAARALVYGPHKIFRTPAEPVAEVDGDVRQLVADLFDTLYHEKGLGIAANMIGIARAVLVVDLQEDGGRQPLAMINPEVVTCSRQTRSYEEASLSFPGIAASITRPERVTVRYLDESGEARELTAEGLLATVIQHEMDYLQGRTFLDHLSSLRRKTLMKKLEKRRRLEQLSG